MSLKKKVPSDAPAAYKIIIVDDHPIVRQGLADLVNQEPDLKVCAQAEDALQAVALIKKFTPHLAVVDIALKDSSGIDLIKDIKIQFPHLLVLALSMHDESLYAERVLRAGAKGYIMKQEATEEVIGAIRKVLDGGIYLSDKMAGKMMRKLVGQPAQPAVYTVESLSDRELEVFLLIGEGFSTRRIAEKLFLSVKTIETYREHLKEKLNLADSAHLLQYAIQWVKSHDQP